MKKMMKNRKGFTLMEMLIVVAIIAILVIIAIPTFNSALAKARAATDVANIRSGYAAAQVAAMTDGYDSTANSTKNTYYLLKDGSVSNDPNAANKYTTQGTSKGAAANTEIGGRFSVDNTATTGGAAATDGKLSWDKGATVTYTVGEVGDDGVPTVTTITTDNAAKN